MRRASGYLATALAAVALPLLAVPPAQASVQVGSLSVSDAALEALCATPQAARTSQEAARTTPKWRRGADTPQLTQAQVLATAPTDPQRAARRAAAVLPDTVTIPVHVTIVRGRHARETNRSPAAAQSWINILNRSFAGATNTAVDGSTRYVFRLASAARVVTNDSWYHAVGGSAADRQMRTTLRRGSADDLNLYITRPGSSSSPILGFARFPWQYASNPKLDGVTISTVSLPGGAATGYNAGDTLVHEVGHWMGLFHTFQGGCGSTGDLVADTAAEATPNFTCPVRRDTCSAPGLDPVHNFMDYSYDSCMDHFTPGQADRMDFHFETHRFGR